MGKSRDRECKKYPGDFGSSDPGRKKGGKLWEESRTQRFFRTNLRKEVYGPERIWNLVLKAALAFQASCPELRTEEAFFKCRKLTRSEAGIAISAEDL